MADARSIPRSGVAAITVALLIGCATPEPPPPPEPIVTTLRFPQFLPADGAASILADAGVLITVAPAQYVAVPQVRDACEDLVPVAMPMRVTRLTRAVVPVLQPDRAAFIVTVVNHSPRPFDGRGCQLAFLLPAKAPTPADGLGLGSLRVPAGGEDRVTVYGPPLSELPPSARVGLQLTMPNTPAVPARTWWFAYATDDHTSVAEPAVLPLPLATVE